MEERKITKPIVLPFPVVHEIIENRHRLIINNKTGKWETLTLPCKLKFTYEGVERTYHASANHIDGLPEIFESVSVYGRTIITEQKPKNIEFRKLDDL